MVDVLSIHASSVANTFLCLSSSKTKKTKNQNNIFETCIPFNKISCRKYDLGLAW